MEKYTFSITEKEGRSRAAQDGAAIKTVQGVWQPPDPARHGESMAPATQEPYLLDPQPGGSHDTRGIVPQPSSAVVSAVAVGANVPRRGLSLYCTHTDLAQNKRETDFHRQSVSVHKAPLPQGVPGVCAPGSVRISSEIRWKQTDVPMGELRPSERPMKKRRAFYRWQKSFTTKASI